MKTCGNLAVGILVCGAAAVIGCDKQVKVTFTNVTSEPLAVEMAEGSRPMWPIGTVAPDGGRLATKLKVDPDELPLTCSYRAGKHAGSFTITKKTPGELWVDFRTLGEPRVRDKKTEVKEDTRIDVKPLPVRREEVVE